jgi:prepilin-type N-terminal cleavage/methylation domain-containing protein
VTIRRSPPPEEHAALRAFTLLEVMAVTAILALILMMLPPRLDGFGSRSRLEAGANTVLSAFTGAREQAIIDGHEVWIEFELGDSKKREEPGRFRYVVINRVTERAQRTQEGEPEPDRATTPEQDEMMPTTWRDMPAGVVLSGFSIEREQWARNNPGDRPFGVRYLADGTVRPACAVRIESSDLPPDVQRTMTVVVNALTGRATLSEGDAELPPSLDASDFR